MNKPTTTDITLAFKSQLSRESFAEWQDAMAEEIRGLLNPQTHYLYRSRNEGAICGRHFNSDGVECVRFAPSSGELVPLIDLLEQVDPEFGQGGG